MMLKQKKKSWYRHRIMPFAIDPTCQTESSGLPGHILLTVGLAINFYKYPGKGVKERRKVFVSVKQLLNFLKITKGRRSHVPMLML
jgi:hypothetical protein